MPDRQPEPWETTAAGAFPQLPRERGTVEVGAGRSAVQGGRTPREEVVVGYVAARERARALARELE
jgi:hypothetical protein